MNKFGDNELEVADLFSRSIFKIPRYQREYSWNKKQINDLINDIKFIYSRKESGANVEHYFGNIVLEDRGKVEVKTENFNKFAIVDGQQRITTITIFVKCLIEEIEWLESNYNDGMGKGIGDWRNKYIHAQGEDRLELGSISQDVYKKLVIDGKEPDNVSKGVEHASGSKLVSAKKEISNRVKEWRQDHLPEDSRDAEKAEKYREYLNNILKVSTNDLKVTVKSIDDMDEAARMFKVINNRGKDLTTFDKVKSHIVYASSRCGLDAKEKYKEFGEIVRNITKYEDCGDDMLDDLINQHWIVFSGESSHIRTKRRGPTHIDKRMAQLSDYADVDSKNVREFIESYINTLKQVSEYYVSLRRPNVFANEYGEKFDKDLRKMQAFSTHSSSAKYYCPTMISVAYNYGIESEKFVRVLSKLEVLFVRYNIVKKEGTDPFRTNFNTLSHNLFWADVSEAKIESIFNSKKDRYKGAESPREGLERIVEEIDSRVEELIDDGEFEEYFLKKDVLEGKFESGYAGMRNKDGIMYILHQYERYLRRGSDTELNNLNSYVDFKEDFELEHLVPKNAESGHKLSPHDKNKNRIGNLAFIGKADNKKWGNKPFKEKYNKLYKNSSYKVLNRLNGPKISTKKVQNRGEKIASFAVKRWSLGN